MEEQKNEALKQNLKTGFKDTVKDIKRFAGGNFFTKVIILVGLLVCFMLVFGMGVAVGFHKSSFGRAWGEHYKENFGIMGRSGKMMGVVTQGGMMGDFPNAHGAAGQIISMNLPTIIVKDKDGTEKVVLIKDETSIERGRDILKDSDLKIDDFVVIIGTPNSQGQIEAKLIRAIPQPEFLK
jgi:hypothetical protein